MRDIDFLDAFPGAYALFQSFRISDHSPTILKFPTLPSMKPEPFKFFNFLAHKGKFLDIMADHWNVDVSGCNMYKVVSKLKKLKKPLRKLLHDQGNIHERVSKLRTEFDEIQKALDLNPVDSMLREEEAVYLHAFNDVKLDEEIFL
nr:RNA-directed DNA polymerase, eukaryota, reverse transcriptase zinc-binding domain protein [Tanacetum cinerariifolium]